MIGAAGLTASAPAAYYVVAGHWSVTSWSLWAANLLFAMNQIHFVQLQIQAAPNRRGVEKRRIGVGFLAGQVVLGVLLAVACALHLFVWYAAIALRAGLGPRICVVHSPVYAAYNPWLREARTGLCMHVRCAPRSLDATTVTGVTESQPDNCVLG
jgi:hypothetical protein